MIRALILDAGQVLAHPAIKNMWNYPVAARDILGFRAELIGTPAWVAACDKASDLIREDVVIADTDGEYRCRRAFVKAVAGDMGMDISEDEISALARDLTDNPARCVWFDDVDEVLARLKGRVRIGVLSDAMPSVRKFIAGHDTRGLIEEVVLSTEIGACKPDRRMYEAIIEKVGVKPEECLFVDDRACNLTGAEKCGMRAAQMLRYDDMTAEYPVTVRDMYDVERLIEKEISRS